MASELLAGDGFFGPGASQAQGVSFLRVADVTALRALDVTPFANTSSFVWMLSVKDGWTWDPTSVLADDGITVVQATGVVTGRWIRRGWAHPYWQAQSAFYVDATGGNDENTGAAAAAALKTLAEWRRRVRGAVYSAVVQLYVTGTVPDTDPLIIDVSFASGAYAASLQVIGYNPTVVYGPSTVTAATPENMAGNVCHDFTDANMPAGTTWTTLGVNVMIQRLDANGNVTGIGYPMRDLGGNKVRVGGHRAVTFAPDVPPGEFKPDTYPGALINFVANDRFRVISLPTIPDIQCSGPVNVHCTGIRIAYATTTKYAFRDLGPVEMYLYYCIFGKYYQPSGAVTSYLSSYSGPVVGGGFGVVGNASLNATYATIISAVPDANSYFAAFDNSRLQLTGETYIQNCQIYQTANGLLGASSSTKIGLFDFAGKTGPVACIGYIYTQFRVGLIWGSGNTVPIIEIAPGGIVAYGAVPVAATTAAAKITVAGVAKVYADLPLAFDTAKCCAMVAA